MQSRTLCCNGTIIRKNLTRGWPLWAAYLLLWMILLPLSMLSRYDLAGSDLARLCEDILEMGAYGGVILSAIYAILVAMVLFSYLYKSRSINTLAALPIARSTMFGSHMATGFLVGVVPNLLVAISTIVVCFASGHDVANAAFQWFAISSLSYVFFFGFATLCAAIVGHTLALLALYGVLNFTVIILNYVFLQNVNNFVYGMSPYVGTNDMLLEKGSPFWVLMTDALTQVYGDVLVEGKLVNSFIDTTYNHWNYLFILVGVGVLFAVVAYFLLQKRHMESSGDVIAVQCLRPVFRYVFALGCSLVLGFLVIATTNCENSIFGTTLCLLFGGFVGYFLAEILLQKSFRVWGKEWIGYGCLAAFICLAMVSIRFDFWGYERQIPQANQVESVSFGSDYSSSRYYGNNDATTIDDPAFINQVLTFHNRLLDEKEAVYQDLTQKSRGQFIEICYTLTDGSWLSRSYIIPYDLSDLSDVLSLMYQCGEIYNDPQYILLRDKVDWDVSTPAAFIGGTITYGLYGAYDEMKGDYDQRPLTVDLTAQETYELYQACILPDILDGNLDYNSDYKVYYSDFWYDGATEIEIYLVNPNEFAKSVTRTYTVFDDATRTVDFLEARGVVIYQTEKDWD